MAITSQPQQAGYPLTNEYRKLGRLHCEVTAYFSPAAAEVARIFDAEPCERPLHRGLDFRHEGTAACLAYEVDCDGDWRTRLGVVHGWAGQYPLDFRITRTPEGIWTLNGQVVPHLQGAVDLDLNFTRPRTCPNCDGLHFRLGRPQRSPSHGSMRMLARWNRCSSAMNGALPECTGTKRHDSVTQPFFRSARSVSWKSIRTCGKRSCDHQLLTLYT